MDMIALVIGFMIGSLIGAIVVSLTLVSHLQKIGCDLTPFFEKGPDNVKEKMGIQSKRKKKK